MYILLIIYVMYSINDLDKTVCLILKFTNSIFYSYFDKSLVVTTIKHSNQIHIFLT